MRPMALGLTAAFALTVPAAPAAAQSFAPQTISQDFSNRPFVARPGGRSDNGFRSDHRRRGGRSGAVFVGNGWYGDDWALNNNRSWDSDSYNDWWHDNPQRAYPRWMQSNQDCQRVWWSGSGWRC